MIPCYDTWTMTKYAMDWLIENVGADNVYTWKLTDKSLVYYLFDADGGKGKRVVLPISFVINQRKPLIINTK